MRTVILFCRLWSLIDTSTVAALTSHSYIAQFISTVSQVMCGACETAVPSMTDGLVGGLSDMPLIVSPLLCLFAYTVCVCEHTRPVRECV